MGTPCSTGAAGFLRLAAEHVPEFAWPLAHMQRDMDEIAKPPSDPEQKRLYRAASTLCACQMTDGFCMPLNKPDCRCWKLARTVLRSIDG